MNLEVTEISTNDDLSTLVKNINSASWDAANEMATYDEPSLAQYLDREDTLFVVCYIGNITGKKLGGFASSRIEHKPYGGEKWLYVDEVDVCVDCRRNGVGTAIMQYILQYAENADCEEIWLGTERDNIAANALYNSLEPDDVESVVGFTFELDE